MAASQQVRGGPGVRVRQHSRNHITVSGVAPPIIWRPAWPIHFNGKEVAVGFGTVNNIEPTIKGVRISGFDDKGVRLKQGQPKLKLLDKFDSEGRQWVCVKVTVTPEGKIDEKKADTVTLEIVNSLAFDPDIKIGRHPLALFRSSGEWFPIAYFNLQHRVAAQADAQSGATQTETTRHFFWPS